MKSDDVIGLIIYLFVSLIMILIGVLQIRSKKPVGFYSGETPPKEDELTDVVMWNKKHGIMWIIYGIIILISFLTAILIGIETVLGISFMFAGAAVPIPVMIYRHNRLKKEYLK